MGELIHLDEYRERKARSVPSDVQKRIAEIAIDMALLQSEKDRLQGLEYGNDPA
jgi:hypothetical protein